MALDGARCLEARWLRFARDAVGESVPEVLGEDDRRFAMEYLEPARHPGWLSLLRRGDISPATAGEVARLIGRLHAASANNFAIGQRFQGSPRFSELRVEPILLAAARAQPALADRIEPLAQSLQRTKLVLIHGDLVPENVLAGPRGPVLIDADYACYGDPAFDAACCLAHLLMLCVWQPDWRDRYLLSFDAFCAAYAQRITWEMPEHTETRTALLIPALLLAEAQREDRPEWLYGDRERELVNAFARKLLLEPVFRLPAVRESWRRFFLD